MSQLDALFSGQIFRKDYPIILACRRDKAVILGARVPYDANGYVAGQVLARDPADGLFKKYSGVSGSLVASVVLFDSMTDSDQISSNGVSGSPAAGVTGSSLVRVIAGGLVYTNMLVDYNSTAATGLKSRDLVDAGGSAITSF